MNPHIVVYQPFFHQDYTNHLQLSNMFTQTLSHMFLRPMCQKPEQLPIKGLLKSSEWKPDCHAWCDTMATQSPHHDWTLKVLERVSQSTTSTCGPISAGDTGTQTNVNTLVWKTERRGRNREGSLGFKTGRWKLGRGIHHWTGQNWSVFQFLHTNTSASRCLCKHQQPWAQVNDFPNTKLC